MMITNLPRQQCVGSSDYLGPPLATLLGPRNSELAQSLLLEKLEGDKAVTYGKSAQLWEKWSSQPTSRPKSQQSCCGTSPASHLGVRLGSRHGAPGLMRL